MNKDNIDTFNCPNKARVAFFKKVDNCYWNPKLTIKTLPDGDRTVIALDAIENDEPLVILNTDSYFGYSKAIKYSVEDISTLDEYLLLPAYLYQFYTKHTLNYPQGYDYYFNALPTYEWYAKNHEVLKIYTSLDPSQKEKAGENLILIKKINLLLTWIETIPNHILNIEQAIRSVFVCSTRTWSVGLVPWIDFFNHAYNGSPLNKEATTITATHTYEKNEEVNTTYGLKDSLELLNIYGFCAKEKTISIPFFPISSFCTALDSDFENYQQFTESNEFLLNKTLHNIEHLIAHFRLCVLNKKDVLFVNDIGKDFKTLINMENEHKAIKLLLLCIKTLHEKIKKIKENYTEITGVLPDKYEEDINMKQEILKKLTEKICVYWMKFLKDDSDQ
jgi:hypothetical protein